MCHVNHCTVERVSEFQRANVWAYVFMASHSVVGTVRALQDHNYSTRQTERSGGADEYTCGGVRMEESPAGSSQHGLR